MPTYDYVCQKCGKKMEIFQSMNDPHLRKCPKCKKLSLKRLMGAGSGLIFKGTGFYVTDYKKKTGTPDSDGTGDGKSSTGDTVKSTTKPEAKSAAK